MEHIELFLKSFTSIFIIMGPFSIVPIFTSLTNDNDDKEKTKIIYKTGLTVIGVCLFFLVFGTNIFQMFGFSIDSFKIAGGLLMLIMAINMLHAKRSNMKQTKHEKNEGLEKDDISIFPLAIPMITGPGTISNIILQSQSATSPERWGILITAILTSTMIICIILKSSDYLLRYLGRTGINILTRLMGLILAAISIEFMVQGIKSSFSIGLI